VDPLTGIFSSGLLETEACGVEAKARCAGHAGIAGVDSGERVEEIATDGGALKHHVRANLVEAAGFDIDAHDSAGQGGFDGAGDVVSADGFLALLGDDDFFDEFAIRAGCLRLFEASLDNAFSGIRDAADDGDIFFVDEAGFEITAKLVIGAGGFGDDEEAGGVLVESMEEAEITACAEVMEKFTVKGEEAVEERIGGVSFAGLSDQAGGFVDDYDVGVLMEDFEANLGIGAHAEQYFVFGFGGFGGHL